VKIQVFSRVAGSDRNKALLGFPGFTMRTPVNGTRGARVSRASGGEEKEATVLKGGQYWGGV